MGKTARISLLLAATACLLAVFVDWVVEELSGETVVVTETLVVEPGTMAA